MTPARAVVEAYRRARSRGKHPEDITLVPWSLDEEVLCEVIDAALAQARRETWREASEVAATMTVDGRPADRDWIAALLAQRAEGRDRV